MFQYKKFLRGKSIDGFLDLKIDARVYRKLVHAAACESGRIHLWLWFLRSVHSLGLHTGASARKASRRHFSSARRFAHSLRNVLSNPKRRRTAIDPSIISPRRRWNGTF
jgi:hypothetical protein